MRRQLGISGSGGVYRDRPGFSNIILVTPHRPCFYRNAIMTLFYTGSLQEGIAAAVRDVKAVTCFVRGR
jgi:hypothetical protein